MVRGMNDRVRDITLFNAYLSEYLNVRNGLTGT
jgi:hypothetical protein